MSLSDQLDPKKSDEKIYGVAAAVITNNQDPDNLGRVKLKFPWLSDENESDWVRLATFMAGTARGAFFLPEVDDEVLVAFEHGDINCPYVIGTLWNGQAAPPRDNADGKNNFRSITSRSGHEIIFCDDSEGKKENLEIHTNAGHSILLDDSSGAEKISIIDKTQKNSITIDSANNAINIECTGALTMKADTVDIQGTTSIGLKSAAVTLNGDDSIQADAASIAVKGTDAVEISANDTAVKGTKSAALESVDVTIQGSKMVKIN